MSNLIGLVPGFMAPTSSINVTLGCALTVWVYYHIQGVREQGIGAYLKHFAAPPGAPLFIAPIMLPIEIISHFSRVLSLSLRLFGNVFGEELVILILFSIVPFVVPLPMMFLGIITMLAAGVHLRHADDDLPGRRGGGGARARGSSRTRRGRRTRMAWRPDLENVEPY